MKIKITFKLTLVTILLIIATSLFAQSSEWEIFYTKSATSFDTYNDMAMDSQGNIYATGQSSDGDFTFCITSKYDPNGIEVWTSLHSAGTPGYDVATNIAIDDSNNVYITGFTYTDSTDNDILTVKYDSNGVVQWSVTCVGNGFSSDKANGIVLTSDGFPVVTGRSGTSNLNNNVITVKYDKLNGSELAVSTYDAGNNDYPNAICIDKNDNIR